jgi:hypothetical protein
MPFRKKARITLENLADQQMTLYYQVNYALGPVTKDAAYLHAQFRREDVCKQRALYDCGRHQGARQVTWAPIMAWEGEQHRLVGRGRDQVLSWTGTRSSPPSAARARRTISAARYNFEDPKTHANYAVVLHPVLGAGTR